MDSTVPDWGKVITAMVTPFTRGGHLDEPGVTKLVDYLIDTGSNSLVISGTTGESPTLTQSEKLRMFQLARTASAGRAKIIAGTGSYSTEETIELSSAAAELGVDALLLVTPYYNKPSQEGMYQHFSAVARAVPLPIMLYNVPPRTSVNLEAATTVRLARDNSNIVAVKEASGNMVQAGDIVAGSDEGFKLYSGEDALTLPLLSVGAVGVVSVTSHLVGCDIQRMVTVFMAGDTRQATKLHLKMMPIVRACFQPSAPSPAPLKAALQMLGLPGGLPRLPLVPAAAGEVAVMKEALAQYGLLPSGSASV